MRSVLFVLSLFFSLSCLADWHKGIINMIAIGYDGKTISVGQVGFTHGNCTCYSTWPNRYCLDRTRDSFKDEYALLLSAKARGTSLGININETTCYIRAIYEQ